MQKNIIKRISLLSLLITTLFLCMFFLTGCQSTDKSNSTFNRSAIEYSSFEYNRSTNQTNVIWTATLTNNTIYNFNSFSVTFKLYKNSTLINTETYDYNRGVKHGADYTGVFNFYADNEIDGIEFLYWSPNYDSFWETYKIWFIVMSIITCIASLIYIIVMIIEDLELCDTFDEIVDFLTNSEFYIVLYFIIPVAGTIWAIVSSYWVPLIIVLGSIIALVLVMLIAHLIKFIVQCIAEAIEFRGASVEYDNNVETVEDCVSDRDKLILFSVEQLKEYCRENEIKGYSSLNKSDLVELIFNHNIGETFEPKKVKNDKTTTKITSNVTFDDIAGLEEAKNAFKEKVVYAFEHKELYEKYGKKIGGGLLLYGLPGTGKTMFAEAASNETDSLFIPIKCSDIKSKWYGESETNVKNIFEKARQSKKAIIFFDEFEAIGAKRTDNSENGNNDLVPQILAEMQGIGSNNTDSIIMVIAATNKPWIIDSAFLRPGRFDEKIYIPLPDLEARKKLFELKLKTAPQDSLDFKYLATITEGFNGADIGAFCDKLKMLAIKKSIATNIECPITMDEVKQVQNTIKSSVSNEDIKQLLEFKNQFQ